MLKFSSTGSRDNVNLEGACRLAISKMPATWSELGILSEDPTWELSAAGLSPPGIR